MSTELHKHGELDITYGLLKSSYIHVHVTTATTMDVRLSYSFKINGTEYFHNFHIVNGMCRKIVLPSTQCLPQNSQHGLKQGSVTHTS